MNAGDHKILVEEDYVERHEYVAHIHYHIPRSRPEEEHPPTRQHLWAEHEADSLFH